MTHAPAHCALYDADSHIKEMPDFLKKYASPKFCDDTPEVGQSLRIGASRLLCRKFPARICQGAGRFCAARATAESDIIGGNGVVTS